MAPRRTVWVGLLVATVCGGGCGGDGRGGGGDGGVDGGDGGGGGGTYQAERRVVCPLESTTGVVYLSGFPTNPQVQGWLFDRRDPWVGPPALTTATCEFHRFVAGCPGGCGPDEVCSIAGECVPQRRAVRDATLTVGADGDQRVFEANPDLGGIYGELDIGTATSSFGMELRWGSYEVLLAPMPVATGDLVDVQVEIEGDSMRPGALDATWTPSTEGAFVRTRIPINHHAGGPTFTECVADDDSGAFHADAGMVNPLAVETGLEFQGLEHVHIAAAAMPGGCVEFRFGTPIHVNVN